MANSFADKHPTKGLMRIMLRLPILLYHNHMGWLLGKRFLMLTTEGRKTGLSRDAVVEIVSHDKITSTYYIASGWGEQSNWYRNIQKTPRVSVRVGNRQYLALASVIPPKDAEQVLYNYTRQHPIASQMLTQLFLGERLRNAFEQSRSLANSIPLVAIKLEEERID